MHPKCLLRIPLDRKQTDWKLTGYVLRCPERSEPDDPVLSEIWEKRRLILRGALA